MKKRLQALRNEEGLTLVELLAVIVILAIIAVVAFVMIAQVIENSKQDAHIANAQQLIQSAKLYEAGGGMFPPAGPTANPGTVTGGELNDAGFIDEIIDPWTKNVESTNQGAVVRKVSSGGDVTYEVTLPATSDECEIEDETLENLAKGRAGVCP